MPCKHIKPLKGEIKFEAWLKRQTNKQTNKPIIRNLVYEWELWINLTGLFTLGREYPPFPIIFWWPHLYWKKKSWGCSLPFSGNLGSVTRTRRLAIVKKSALKVVFNISPIRASKHCFYYSDKRLWGIVNAKKISLNQPPNNKFSGLLNLGVVKMTDLYCGYSPPLSRTSVAVWSWLDNFTVLSAHKL